MAPNNITLYFLRTHKHIYGVIVSCFLLVVMLILASPIMAQQYGPDGPPFPVVTPPPFAGGFYVHGGVKFRVLKTLRFNRIEGHGAMIRQGDGLPAFGPTSDGIVMFPSDSADWVYGNGQILSSGGDTAWTAADAIANAANTTEGPGGLGYYSTVDSSLGQFELLANHPLAISLAEVVDGTIQFSGALNDATQSWTDQQSIIVGYGTTDVEPVVFDPQYWTPFVEIGYNYSPYFDILLSVAWFNITESDTDMRPTVAQWYERRFTDTYQFRTTLAAGSGVTWSATDSDTLGTANTADILIYPVGFIGQSDPQLPVRTFSENVVAANLSATEMLNTKLNVDVIEMKLGVRNWYPLWGMARSGFTCGGIFAPMPYTIDTTVSIVIPDSTEANTVPDPDTGLAIQNIPGTYGLLSRKQDVWWNFGGYVGADFQLYAGPVYVLTGAEYNWYFEQKHSDFSTETIIDPSGYTITFAGGFRF